MSASRLRYLPSFYRLGFPIVIRSLLSNSLFILDNIMIGSLGEVSLAGVAQANQLSSLANLFIYGIVASCCIFLSQFWGQKDIDGFHRTMGLNALLSLVIASVAAIVAAVFPRAFLSLYLTEADAISRGAQYLRIIWPVYPLMAVTQTFSAGNDSSERVKLPMAAGIASMLTNTLLNYCLIFGRFGFPALGLTGGAIATLCAASVECLVMVVFTYLKRYPAALSFRSLLPSRAFFKRFIKVAVPVVANEGLYGLGGSVLAMIYGSMGTVVVAAIAIADSLQRFLTVLVKGVVHASGILVGKLIGENRDDEAYSCGKQAIFCSVVLAILCSVVVLLLRDPLLSLYDISPEALQTARTLVLILAIITPVRMMLWVETIGVTRAGGDTVFVMWMDLIGMWCYTLPLAALSALLLKWSIAPVFLLVFSEDAIKTILSLFRFRSRRWIHHLTSDPSSDA